MLPEVVDAVAIGALEVPARSGLKLGQVVSLFQIEETIIERRLENHGKKEEE